MTLVARGIMIVNIILLCAVIGGCLFGLYLSFKGLYCLFRREVKSGLLYLVVGVPLFLALAAPLVLPAFITEHHSAKRHRCRMNLNQIVLACKMYAIDHNEEFPPSFLVLTNHVSDARLFVCPGSDHKPGSLHTVDAWTDYVLVTNLSEQAPSGSVLAYCKPGNHRGQDGVTGINVVYVDGSISWVPAAEFSKLTCDVLKTSRINDREPQPRHP